MGLVIILCFNTTLEVHKLSRCVENKDNKVTLMLVNFDCYLHATPEIKIQGASYLSFIKDLGDHRVTAIDVTIASLLGMDLPKIVCAKARWLNSQS